MKPSKFSALENFDSVFIVRITEVACYFEIRMLIAQYWMTSGKVLFV